MTGGRRTWPRHLELLSLRYAIFLYTYVKMSENERKREGKEEVYQYKVQSEPSSLSATTAVDQSIADAHFSPKKKIRIVIIL